MENASPKFQVYSVSEVAEILRGLLEDSLPAIRVQGEISNFRNPAGHWYFVLKDAHAQLRCAMFKGQNYMVRPVPKNGDANAFNKRLLDLSKSTHTSRLAGWRARRL